MVWFDPAALAVSSMKYDLRMDRDAHWCSKIPIHISHKIAVTVSCLTLQCLPTVHVNVAEMYRKVCRWMMWIDAAKSPYIYYDSIIYDRGWFNDRFVVFPPWATPFKIHTPPVEDFVKVDYMEGVNFQIHLPSVWFLVYVYHRGIKYFIQKCQMSLSTWNSDYRRASFFFWFYDKNRKIEKRNLHLTEDQSSRN